MTNAFPNAWKTYLPDPAEKIGAFIANKLIPSINGAHSAPCGHSTGSLLKKSYDFTLVRKTINFFLGKYLSAVGTDGKHTTGAGNQFHLNLRTKFTFQLSFQTGSPWLVLSCRAVFNGYLHCFPSSELIVSYWAA